MASFIGVEMGGEEVTNWGTEAHTNFANGILMGGKAVT